MENPRIMKNGLASLAGSLAFLMFFQSTAYGISIIVNHQWSSYDFTIQSNSTFEGNEVNPFSSILPNESLDVIDLPITPIVNGGPDQPEVQSFTPIGTSDMVDPFTGDFSYNIPLLDVDGYPINIAYNAGVTMDQEATWVGLGWNLNPGVVNRAMRGIPDDYNGSEKIEKTMNLKKNWTVGGSLAFDYELFGFGEFEGGGDQEGSFSLNASIGVSYNNYNGFSGNFSTGLGASGMGIGDNGAMNAGLGFSGSSTGGASISPTIGFSYQKNNTEEKTAVTKGINLGAPFNSRGGFNSVNISYSRTVTENPYNRNMRQLNRVKLAGEKTKSSFSSSSNFNFGMSTFTPYISMPMQYAGGTFSFKLGGDIVGNDASGEISGFYSEQKLKNPFKSEPAYGYFNLALGQSNKNAMLDFNRENDGPFTKNTPALPVPNVTYDIFSVSGQGVAGSYRPYRQDIGYVFDPYAKSNTVNGSLGVEVNLGATIKGGIDLAATYAESESGPWTAGGNKAAKKMKYNSDGFYFREANELSVNGDPNHFNKIGKADAVRFNVVSHTKIENTLDDTQGNFYSENSYNKNGVDKRNQIMYALNVGEMKANWGIQPIDGNAYINSTSAYNHHIGQFTVLNTEGSRYVYGIPAYSVHQTNVSFATGDSDLPAILPQGENIQKGRIGYTAGWDNSTGNGHGVDNYYNKLKTPAFAHSYLLTTVLNVDYVDADAITGPSKGDLGGYLKFKYKLHDASYIWRNPIEKDEASFDEGLNSDPYDDKAHYTWGEKELWYLDTIISKNHIAIFHTSNRNDGYEVLDENGGLNSSGKAMQKLDSISLYSLPDYELNGASATPLKTVHFEYDYSLCNNYSGNMNPTEGKLTLTKIYFTYQDSEKGRRTPYVFTYGQKFDPINGDELAIINPDYNMKEIDRWNNYKKQNGWTGDLTVDPLRPSDFPYVGYDINKVNDASIAWNLTTIHLPSGGKIQVDYEADQYAYVQHKRANQMLKIVAVDDVYNPSQKVESGTASVSNDDLKNAKIYFELVPGNENINDYVKPGELIYFRVLVRFNNGSFDYVPGYAEVGTEIAPYITTLNDGVTKVGCLPLVGTKLLDNGSSDYNPISVAAIQYARIYLSKFIPPSSSGAPAGDDPSNPGFLEALGGAFTSYQELFIGPNKPLWNDNIGTNIVLDHSWVRLQNPNKRKLGGGHRVKKIRMFDAWDEMTGNMDGYFYGQTYSYNLEDGTSSGVASYEPQLGGDENPWRQPIANNTRNLLAPDVKNYQETPFGEQFFPSPSVGYSMVTIKDLPRENVTRTATGKIVHEFYTAKDFPTIVKRTNVDLERYKLPIWALFFSSMIDEMAASQGFVVETNDMHGKPFRQSVYAEGQSEAITKVEYTYQSEPMAFDGVAAKHLVNKVKAIHPDGTIGNVEVGLNYDAFADFRNSLSQTINGSLGLNLNYTIPFVLLPGISGSASYERTAFRSATFTKVIQRFGILEKTTAKDLGSVVETNNLAYDSETGNVLVTQTTTDFNDKVYNFTYPAHWYYDQMGHAYRNIGKNVGTLAFVSGGTTGTNNSIFSVADEVAITFTNNTKVLGWVVEASPAGIRVLLKDGSPLVGNVKSMKILRSGRKNLQGTPIGTIVLRANPLDNLQGNIFDKVLQAGAVEFSDDWRTFCECFLNEENPYYTTNPYVLGTKGNWRPKASYVHLSGRTQTFENQNSNIREDGVFTSFTPFYKLNSGDWSIDKNNWTYTSSVTEFSPFGQALETIDALDRYSASMFGYNQTLPMAVAANTRYSQLGFDGFEDYDFDNCSDNHFRIGEGAEIIDGISHTGHRSIKVSANEPVTFSNVLVDECTDTVDCDYGIAVALPARTLTAYFNLSEISAQGGEFSYEVINGEPGITYWTGDEDENGVTDGVDEEWIIFQFTANSETGVINEHVTFTIIDENGCTGTGTIGNTDDPEPCDLNVITENYNPCSAIECTNYSIHVIPNGVAPYTYEFTTNHPTEFNFAEGTEDDAYLSNCCNTLENLYYQLIITDASGCTDKLTYGTNNPCDLNVQVTSLTYDYASGEANKTVYTPIGEAPYSYDYTIISGTPVITENTTSIEFANESTEDLVYNLTITDANGCLYTIENQIVAGVEVDCQLIIQETATSQEHNSSSAIGFGNNITVDGYFSYTNSFTANFGVEPYTIVYDIVNGSPNVSTTSNSISFSYDNDQIIVLSGSITDANGCEEEFSIDNSSNGCELQVKSEIKTIYENTTFPYGNFIEKNYKITVLNGTAPYTITYNITEGNPVIDQGADYIEFKMLTNTPFHATVDIVDANGCTDHKEF